MAKKVIFRHKNITNQLNDEKITVFFIDKHTAVLNKEQALKVAEDIRRHYDTP